MDIVRAFVSVDRLEVHAVSDDMVLVRDAVASQSITASTGNVQCFAAVVSFDEGNHFWQSSEKSNAKIRNQFPFQTNRAF